MVQGHSLGRGRTRARPPSPAALAVPPAPWGSPGSIFVRVTCGKTWSGLPAFAVTQSVSGTLAFRWPFTIASQVSHAWLLATESSHSLWTVSSPTPPSCTLLLTPPWALGLSTLQCVGRLPSPAPSGPFPIHPCFSGSQRLTLMGFISVDFLLLWPRGGAGRRGEEKGSMDGGHFL